MNRLVFVASRVLMFEDSCFRGHGWDTTNETSVDTLTPKPHNMRSKALGELRLERTDPGFLPCFKSIAGPQASLAVAMRSFCTVLFFYLNSTPPPKNSPEPNSEVTLRSCMTSTCISRSGPASRWCGLEIYTMNSKASWHGTQTRYACKGFSHGVSDMGF